MPAAATAICGDTLLEARLSQPLGRDVFSLKDWMPLCCRIRGVD
jgi:hypothetical protein